MDREYFMVTHGPDLTETGLPMHRTYVAVEWSGHPAQNSVRLCLEGWCYERYGSPVAYVQGVAPCSAWAAHDSDAERWHKAAPIRWGGHDTKTRRVVLRLGRKKHSEESATVVSDDVSSGPITDKRKASEDLRAERDRYREALQQISSNGAAWEQSLARKALEGDA